MIAQPQQHDQQTQLTPTIKKTDSFEFEPQLQRQISTRNQSSTSTTPSRHSINTSINTTNNTLKKSISNLILNNITTPSSIIQPSTTNTQTYQQLRSSSFTPTQSPTTTTPVVPNFYTEGRHRSQSTINSPTFSSTPISVLATTTAANTTAPTTPTNPNNVFLNSISRPKLPRTNPNYINVDLVTNDGKIKSTYVRFDQNNSSGHNTLNHNHNNTTTINTVNNSQNNNHNNNNTNILTCSNNIHGFLNPLISPPRSPLLIQSTNNSNTIDLTNIICASCSLHINPSSNILIPHCSCPIIQPPPQKSSSPRIQQQQQQQQLSSSSSSFTFQSTSSLLNTPINSPPLTPNQANNVDSLIINNNFATKYNELKQQQQQQQSQSQQQQQQQQPALYIQNDFASSNTLCNYSYTDENKPLINSNNMNKTNNDRKTMTINNDDTITYNNNYILNDSITDNNNVFADDNEMDSSNIISRSPSIRFKSHSNTISYPSLHRRHLSEKNTTSTGTNSTTSFLNELFRPNSIFLSNNNNNHHHHHNHNNNNNTLNNNNNGAKKDVDDNISLKSVISLHRTFTQPRSTNSFLRNGTNTSTSSLNNAILKYNEKQNKLTISPNLNSNSYKVRSHTTSIIGNGNSNSSNSNYSSNNYAKDDLNNDSSSSNEINLNIHKKGALFFSKKISTMDLLQWSKDSIQKPLIKTNDKTVKKEASDLFKLIQMYMGDRRAKNSDLMIICLEIMTKGWTYSVLRDELYLQLIKQTHYNPTRHSLKCGWELIAISLTFFPPSQKLYPILYDYIRTNMSDDEELPSPNENNNENSNSNNNGSGMGSGGDFVDINKYAKTCLKRLERIHTTGAKKGLKRPSPDEIELSKNTITSVSLFGTTLSEIMSWQNDRCPELRLPWIQTTLSEAVLRLHGAKTEGIFRVPGDLDEVNSLKVKYDKIWCSEEFCTKNLMKLNLLENVEDAHLPASLLKLWYRELYEPLIPNQYYEDCIKYCDNTIECIKIIDKLPSINKYVLMYLIRFLQVFSATDHVSLTKMDVNNLAMIMAPNCLRCQSDDPRTIIENTKKEMLFLKTLILNLDTTLIQGIK